MEEIITSTSNLRIKNIIKLRKPRESREQGMILVEGETEIVMAQKAGFEILEFYYCPEFSRNTSAGLVIFKQKINQVSREVFDKISYRENPDGFLALVKRVERNLFDIKLSKKPLVIVLEGIEKPGNLGAIIRTAEATGVDAVVLNDSNIDIYNPNAIRASRGAIFSNQVVNASREDTLVWLKNNKINTFATSKAGSKVYTNCNYKKGTAFIMGSEHKGISKEWKDIADEFINIPMIGGVSSLNLSVSAAILLFEAVRQRD